MAGNTLPYPILGTIGGTENYIITEQIVDEYRKPKPSNAMPIIIGLSILGLIAVPFIFSEQKTYTGKTR